jgi:regulator of replication initiation timing
MGRCRKNPYSINDYAIMLRNWNAMMNIESEVQDIKQKVIEISQKLDELLQENETIAVMKLSEHSLYTFLNDEPDLYTISDVKVVYQ